MKELVLTAEQEAEAKRLSEKFEQSFRDELLGMARLLASKPDRQLLGQTEFEVRDIVHRIGAQAIATALDERKKRGT
jgi:hypothetical protein